jgi:hypothetical protein
MKLSNVPALAGAMAQAVQQLQQAQPPPQRDDSFALSM